MKAADKEELARQLAQQSVPRAILYARIRELEAEVKRMKPVVEAVVTWNRTDYRHLDQCERALTAISDACDAYEASQPK